MLDLTSQHIDQIRNYFIATSDEEKRSLQNTIAPMFLKGFLDDLKKLFVYEPENETKLISIAKSMGASKHIEELKEIQQQFYSQLAEIYLNEETNHDIAQLLKTHNQIFLNEVSFQKDLQGSFILNERESLKKKFVEIDKASDISSSKIEDSFRFIERERLKKKFQELDFSDYEEAIPDNYMVAEPMADYNYENKETVIRASASVIKFNWKKFAIAASVVGLILISAILIINNNKSTKEIAKSDDKKGEVINKVDSNLVNNEFENKATELFANHKLKYKEMQVPILKEEALGFSTKEEKINVRVYDTKERIAELKKFNRTLVGSNGSNSYEITIKNQIDSLHSLNNKYTFDGKTIALYISDTSKIESFKLINKYFIKIGDNVYSIIKSTKLTVLNKVTDNNILEKIDKINFQQNN